MKDRELNYHPMNNTFTLDGVEVDLESAKDLANQPGVNFNMALVTVINHQWDMEAVTQYYAD